jgi:hypothetical protein
MRRYFIAQVSGSNGRSFGQSFPGRRVRQACAPTAVYEGHATARTEPPFSDPGPHDY